MTKPNDPEILAPVSSQAPAPQKDLQEAIERVEMMIADKGETWDLSPNDQKALRLVLDSMTKPPEKLNTAHKSGPSGDSPSEEKASGISG